MATKKTRRTKNLQIDILTLSKSKKTLECKLCFIPVYNVGFNAKSVICSMCVQKLAAPPHIYKKEEPKEKRPHGWWLKKEYISPSGILYRYGKEVQKNDIIIQSDKNTNRSEKPKSKRSTSTGRSDSKSRKSTNIKKDKGIATSNGRIGRSRTKRK